MALDRDQVALIAALPPGRLQLTPAGPTDTFTLRATSWVGSVVLPGLTIRLLPKVEDLRTVFTMMASGADLVDWSSDRATYDREDLVEGVADLLLREVSPRDPAGTRARVPPHRGAAAGPARPARHPGARRRGPGSGGRSRAATTSSPRTSPRTGSFSRPSSTSHGGRSVPSCDAPSRMCGSGWPRSVTRRLPLLEAEQLRTTPLNEHYQPALALARLVLEGVGPDPGRRWRLGTLVPGGHEQAVREMDRRRADRLGCGPLLRCPSSTRLP